MKALPILLDATSIVVWSTSIARSQIRQLSPDDIEKLDSVKKAAADGPVGDDLGLLQKIEMRIEKRDECRKPANAKKFGLVARLDFIRDCMK